MPLVQDNAPENPSGHSARRSWATGGLIAGGVVLLVAVLAVVGSTFLWLEQQRQVKARQAPQCLSNVKQLSIAVLMYAQDYDEHLPSASQWGPVLQPYVKNMLVMRCPSAPELASGYAFNGRLEGLLLSALPAPAQTPTLFDSSVGSPVAADALTSFTPRHLPSSGPRGTVAFADGHAKQYPTAPPAAPLGTPPAVRSSGNRAAPP